MPDPLPLEDTAADIVGKAMRGLQLSEADLAARAGVAPASILALREGTFDEATARAIAPLLHLSANALVASGLHSWRPDPLEVEGIVCFTTPFEDMMVNSYIAFDADTHEAIAFDTGADATPMLDFIKQEALSLKLILLTHTHRDHVHDLTRLQRETGANVFVGNGEPIEGARTFREGRCFDCYDLHVETRLTRGHSAGGITYLIQGFAWPVAIVGDAIFAGSMGGGSFSYADAIRTNREQILTLPGNTVLCPGHGPLSTVEQELKHNPFFAR